MRDKRNAAISANAFEAELALNLAHRAIEKGEFQKALTHLKAAVDLTPRDPRIHVTFGVVFWRLRRPGSAEKAFTAALKLSPRDGPALFGLGWCKFEADEHEEAESLLRRAVEANPSNLHAQTMLAATLGNLSRFEEAENLLSAAIQAHPRPDAASYSALANLMRDLGRFDESARLFNKSLEMNPHHGAAFRGLVNIKRVNPSDCDLVEKMKLLLREPRLGNEDKMYLLSGLGKAYDDLGDFGAAMECFTEANRLNHEAKGTPELFSIEDQGRHLAAIREVFTREFIEAYRSHNDAVPKPIFVVGMMRSGTTLVEQILSSHPDVAAGGEIKFWTDEAILGTDPKRFAFDDRTAFGSRTRYNRRIRRISQTAAFVTDKMPSNYEVLGAIHVLFPEAKIIHCTRHPVDTCLSILTTLFRRPPAFSKDAETIAIAYRQYQEHMAYWREVLPASTLLDVNYEALIADPERVTRQMIEFCGLEWDAACMRPEDNPRPVATASVWQVRQPIYRSSTARWRNYRRWLGPLEELLEPSEKEA